MKKEDIVSSEFVEDVLGQYDSKTGKVKWVSPLVNIATVINNNGETLEKILPTSSKEIQDEINKILEDVPKAIQAINEFKAYLESNPDVLQTIQAIEENKVDKVEGYGLSKNDFTDELLTKLSKIENEANKVEIINNLEETLSGKALDAYQGYMLSQSLQAISQNKVDKVEGYGLSTNDYTAAEKNKLSGIQVGAEKNIMTSADKTKLDELNYTRTMTQAQYDALSTSEKNRTDVWYGIYEE